MSRVVVEAKTISKGSLSEKFEDISKGPLPKRLILAFVESNSYTGTINKNPFNFKNFGLSELSLSIDGEQIPYQPLEFDFDKNKYILGYYTLVNNIDSNVISNGNDITLDDYKNGYTLFSFDLSPDSCSSEHNLEKIGNLRLEVSFKNELTTNIKLIQYFEYNSILEVNKFRKVILN